MAPKKSAKPYTKPLSPVQLQLQKKLAITPKTATLLIRIGYKEYTDLRHESPNQIITQMKSLPDVPAKQAEWFRRPLRRMVWLGTQADPEREAKRTAHPSFWTVKGLVAKGVWQEDYDDLTGEQVNAKFMALADGS